MYNEKPQINYFSIIFLVAEFMFIVILAAILSNLLGTNNITTDSSGHPIAPINNLRSSIPELSSEMATTTERQLYTALFANSPTGTISNSMTKASVVTDSVIRNNFDNAGVNLVSAAIDVPALGQSYSFYYGYPQEGNNDFQAFYTILCPVSDNVGSYSDFNCRDAIEGNVDKNTILSAFLSYFDFAYFSASLDPNNPSRIIISPSVTYDNNQKTKDGFIKEVQDAIDSLGMDSKDYEYYVRTAADIDYENKDR